MLLDLELTIAPSLMWRRHDEEALAYGVVREDYNGVVLARLQRRGPDAGLVTPYLSYVYTRNWSSIELFDYSRTRVEVGFATTF